MSLIVIEPRRGGGGVSSALFTGAFSVGPCGSHQEGRRLCSKAALPASVAVARLPSGHLGSEGVALPSRTFWNPKFLLPLPVLCLLLVSVGGRRPFQIC